VEVINAGIPGYTTYNEVFFYQNKAKDYKADIVILALCLNDIVNPQLHWMDNEAAVSKRHVQDAAIPNLVDHQQRVSSLISSYARYSWVKHLALYRLINSYMQDRWLRERRQHFDKRLVEIDGRNWPTYVTFEDTLSLQVLMDDRTPEWEWMTALLDQLFTSIRDQGATPILLILPLGYQLDTDYPFLPQARIKTFCQRKEILTIDPLPAFRLHQNEQIYLDSLDIWHFTEKGHSIVADELSAFIDSLVVHRTDSIPKLPI